MVALGGGAGSHERGTAVRGIGEPSAGRDMPDLKCAAVPRRARI